MLRRLPHVDHVGIEERAAWLGKRWIKTTAKEQGIRLAVSMVDLTTLEEKSLVPGPAKTIIVGSKTSTLYYTISFPASFIIRGETI